MGSHINPHLNILVQLAKVDGSADDSELELIRRIGSSKNLSDEDIEFAISTSEESDFVHDVSEFSLEEKLELIYNLVLVMKADGIVHKEEMKFCLKVIQKMGFKDEALFELVSNTRVEGSDQVDKDEILKNAATFLK